MNFLLDTNILISAEPTTHGDVEQVTPIVAELLGALARGRHGYAVHPASLGEISRDKDVQRRSTRLMLIAKYPELPHPPSMSTRLIALLGTPTAGSHNGTDLLLLSALDADAVDYFITEDEGIHKRARRTGLSDRTLTVADALATIRALFPSVPTPPPHVVATIAHALRDDPIFASLRVDYPTFDDWLSKCKREQRRTWVIENAGQYAGFCLLKDEAPPVPWSLGKSAKICTFKVSDSFRGFRYGELLLKTLFSYLHENGYEGAFVDVLPKHESLIELFSDFGFQVATTKPTTTELVMLKSFKPAPGDAPLAALDFNIRHGPFSLKVEGAQVFIIPIQPRFNQLLFPESERQLQFRTEVHPFANSIRKAYLCHSAVRTIRAGDLLLFYCSAPAQAVTAIGVADGTLISDQAPAIARYVGRRTVYPYSEIEKMAVTPILAILFRLSRVLPTAWPLDLLTRTGIIRKAPQSVAQVKNLEAITWVAKQLGAWR